MQKKQKLDGCFKKPTSEEIKKISDYITLENKSTLKFFHRTCVVLSIFELLLLIGIIDSDEKVMLLMIFLFLVLLLYFFILLHDINEKLRFVKKITSGCFDIQYALITDTSTSPDSYGKINVWITSSDGTFDSGWYLIPYTKLGININDPVVIIRVFSDRKKTYKYVIKPE